MTKILWKENHIQYPSLFAREAERVKVHKEKALTGPQTGIYFWVLLPVRRWAILHFFESIHGEVSHSRIWAEEVLPYLLEVWKKFPSASVRLELQNSYSGFPRGRIAVPQGGGFAHYCGNDAPKKTFVSEINNAFGLINAKVDLIFDSHERMLSEDQSLIQEFFRPQPIPK